VLVVFQSASVQLTPFLGVAMMSLKPAVHTAAEQTSRWRKESFA